MIEGMHPRQPLTSTDVGGFSAALRALASGVDDAELVDQIRALEELKSAAAAAQARVTARFAASQRAQQQTKGVPANDIGKGIGAQVGLARRDSPFKGSRHLGLAEALVNEMPHTLAALEAGHISEWRATLIARETGCLTREHRAQVDAELACRPGGLEALGDRATATEARRIGYRLDPHAFTARARKAESERRITIRPAPDTMAYLTGLGPAKQAIAAYAALGRHADSLRAQGDPRSRGQIMYDTAIERLTGQASADQVPIEVNLHLCDDTLFDDDPDQNREPADLEGYGPIPAPLARHWLRPDTADTTADTTGNTGNTDDTSAPAKTADSADPDERAARVWLRRLYRRPSDAQLVAMDSHRRCFDGALRRFLIARDRVCRTPWCDAPIRHADHPVSASKDGPTRAANGQGLCEACNYAKEAAGWDTTVLHDGTADGTVQTSIAQTSIAQTSTVQTSTVQTSTVQTTTPTGHRYVTRPPPGIGRPPPTQTDPAEPPQTTSRVETYFHELVLAS